MSSTKRYQSSDKRYNTKHDSYRDKERIKDIHASRYDDSQRHDKKGEDLRLKIKRLKEEQEEITEYKKPRVQLDHLNDDNDSECGEYSQRTNLLGRPTTSKLDISEKEKSPVKAKVEIYKALLDNNEMVGENEKSYNLKSNSPIEIKNTVLIVEESESEESSSDDAEYALACLIKQYAKKKKKRKHNSSDEDLIVKKKRKKKKTYDSSDDKSIKSETKTNKTGDLRKQSKKKNKKKKYESETQGEDSELEKEKMSKKSKKKKKKKKKIKKKRTKTSSDSSSSDGDTSGLEDELEKIRKLKEMKMNQLINKELKYTDKEVENNDKHHKFSTQTKTPKAIIVATDSDTYLDSEAEDALKKARQDFNNSHDIKNSEVKRVKDDSYKSRKSRKDILQNGEKDREQKSETHDRHVRYCKEEDKKLKIKREIEIDKTTKARNRIMNNMRNKISEVKKESSTKESTIHTDSEHRSKSIERTQSSSEKSHRIHRSISDQQSSCSTNSASSSYSNILNQKKNYHEEQYYEQKRDHKYRNDQRDESSIEVRSSSSTRTAREQQPKCYTSYSEKIDQFINQKTRLIYEDKRKRDLLYCCSFCGISNHKIYDCTEKESSGSNPLDGQGRKIECCQCGSFNHFLDVCIHTETNGSNPFGFDGQKFKCGHCGSFDHKTNKCGKIHCEKLGKNPIGISGRKIACDNCNSFDHFGNDCTGIAAGQITRKHETSCEHCGSFSHGSENCKEEPRVIRYVRDPVSIESYFPFPKSTPVQELPSTDDSSFSFCQLPVEAAHGPCNWCKSDNHCQKTCPVKNEREYGVNKKNQFGVMMDCEQCGSYNHLADVCFHTVANGKNPVDHNGKKLACIFCGSYNHTYPCKDKDLEKNGRSQKDADGNKCSCEYCGSYDHLEKHCCHTKTFGRNFNGQNGAKKRCPFCGSYDHETERYCMSINDQTREFLRKKIGFEKKKPSDQQSVHINKFANILTGGHSWQGNNSPIVVDLDGEANAKQRTSRWSNYKAVSASRTSFNGCDLSQEEKVEQIDAEKKMKERLMAKFKVIDPSFFGSESLPKKEASPELNPPNQEIERAEEPDEIFQEEIMDEMVYDEPDESIFNDVELRVKTNKYPRITTNMHNDIVNAITSEEDKITSGHNINITKHDLYGLTGQNWLNDKVIEFYLQMVAARSQTLDYIELRMPRIHCMSTYFFLNLIMRGYDALERWTKDVDIFSFDILLVPIHMDMHWCIAIIDFRSQGVFYYDSMGGHNMPALSAILAYLKEEHMNKKGTELDLRHFAKEIVSDCPQQTNGSDCGIFACKVAEYLSRETPLSFDQEDMAYYRKRMVWEIIKNQLLSP